MAFPSRGTCHRPTVTGRRGMIASAHPLASVAGLRILMAGGNAVDAAIATAAALNVAEPFMSGLGGIGYMNISCASRNEHKILDYVGLTPRAAELSRYDHVDQANSGPLSPIVPGACGGWLAALERYGTMDAAAVFEPAIEYAEQGIGMTATGSRFFGAAASGLHATGAATYLVDGRAPRPGEVLVQADLAQTYRTIAADGPDAFYRGAIADKIVSFMSDNGGLITAEDLTGFTPAWLDPVDVDYRGFRVCAPPPPCQAVQYLETLNIMEGFDVTEMGHNSAQTLHTFLEAAKLAIADRVDFAAIAERSSTGPSAAQGGDLGYIVKAKVVPAFANAAFALKSGEYTKSPVQTQYGWHIILAVDRRQAALASFDELAEGLRNKMRQEVGRQIVDDLRQGAAVERFNIDGSPVAPAPKKE